MGARRSCGDTFRLYLFLDHNCFCCINGIVYHLGDKQDCQIDNAVHCFSLLSKRKSRRVFTFYGHHIFLFIFVFSRNPIRKTHYFISNIHFCTFNVHFLTFNVHFFVERSLFFISVSMIMIT